ncbi:MAG TPA: hypothetical protein VH637_16530 [Streptosporangiaceae bacterium]|jgi:hypothetical protein
MRFTRTRVLLTAGLLAVAGAASATVVAASPASAAPSPVVTVDCAGHGQVRPARLDSFGCMPSQQLLAGLRWTSWRSSAFGHGYLEVNNCTPTCAQGRFVRFPVLTVLWRARPWPRHQGRMYFSRLTWIYTGKRPQPHDRAALTMTLPAS